MICLPFEKKNRFNEQNKKNKNKKIKCVNIAFLLRNSSYRTSYMNMRSANDNVTDNLLYVMRNNFAFAALSAL